MRPQDPASEHPHPIVQRLARGESAQAMLRKGEIAGQALALAQHMAAQYLAGQHAGNVRPQSGGR